MGLRDGRITGHAGVMPDRPFRAVDELIRRVQRVAADRPDPVHVLAEMISIVGESDADRMLSGRAGRGRGPYARSILPARKAGGDGCDADRIAGGPS